MKSGRLLILLVSVAATLAAASPVGAVPAPPDARINLRQPDGSRFTARIFGDEWYHGYRTLSGYTIIRNPATRYWTYAVRGEGGRLAPSARVVGRALPPARARPNMLDTVLLDASAARAASAHAGPVYPGIGTHRSLVILAAYANTTQATQPATWASRFFGATGSVNHYYREASYNQLGFSAAAETHGTYADGVVGWVKITTRNGPVGTVAQPHIADALTAANPYVNFASYDTNRNGHIEPNELHVTVIAAGREAATCGENSGVWAHQWTTGSSTPVLDGVYVGGKGYTIFGEIQCSGAATRVATLGVIVHEIGHDLGLPDLYDIDKTSSGGLNGGVGDWSVMSSGNWNFLQGQQSGDSPAHPDAFLKSYMGWLTPQQVTGPVNGVALAQAETNARAVRLRANPNGVDWSFGSRSGNGEYFLLENRQRVGYDQALRGCGVLIWHVNEAVTSGNSANANEAGARLLDLEEGDNNSFPRNAADVWSSVKGEFNDTSAPDARLYSGALSGVKVRTVSTACAGTMTVNTADGSAGPTIANDNFASPTQVATVPYAQTAIATATATKEGAEQAPTCDATIGKTLWWRFTPATNMRVKAETTGSGYDTVLAAWSGTTLGSLTQVACNDDAGAAGGPSSFEADLTGGVTYYFQAGGFGAAGGNLNFALSRVTNAPGNDNFTNASGIGILPFEQAGLPNADATAQTGEPAPSCGAIGKTVWYRFTPSVNMRVKAETAGSSFDTVLVAYRGTAITGLTQVACNDDLPGFPGAASAFEVDLSANQTYYFQAGGFNDGATVASGNLSFKLSRVLTGPGNDGFGGATVVSSLPFTAAASNAGATVEAGEPTPSCGAIGKTVWYRYTPAATTAVIAETSNSSLNFDTVLAAYSGTSIGALTEVGCNDDYGSTGEGGGPSRFQVTLTGGQTYYFQAGGFRNAAGIVSEGTLGFKLTVVGTPDAFANATVVGAIPFSHSGSTAGATEEGGEPAPSCAPIGKTVWYRFVPGANQTVTFSTAGSGFDSVLAVWRGTSLGALTQVGCDDDGVAAGGASRIQSLALTAGQTYYIQVGGYRSTNTTANGSYSLSMTAG
jgi:M6 family metalloprotease-like protein